MRISDGGPTTTTTLLSAKLDQIVIEAFVATEGPSLCVYVILEKSECVPSLRVAILIVSILGQIISFEPEQ